MRVFSYESNPTTNPAIPPADLLKARAAAAAAAAEAAAAAAGNVGEAAPVGKEEGGGGGGHGTWGRSPGEAGPGPWTGNTKH